jgi:hypothetical protein
MIHWMAEQITMLTESDDLWEAVSKLLLPVRWDEGRWGPGYWGLDLEIKGGIRYPEKDARTIFAAWPTLKGDPSWLAEILRRVYRYYDSCGLRAQGKTPPDWRDFKRARSQRLAHAEGALRSFGKPVIGGNRVHLQLVQG